ncbi:MULTISPECIES: cysteine desulfurase [Sphingobacterium]|uniref:Cysteine desulfurase n=2 Tax=Sphingobacterium TaxID=28453 RepID=A0A653Z329_SPHMU|nr:MULTISPECIES: cysteine desulfurase [Sphingobacterium]HBI88007.1 cysteine desulfurase CsdA [Sphingobacterium sp.]QQT47332.1 cysteine desulfurase [Sphingobacterium multivorum]TWI18153.1 cysteine desulfurase/selenocysteine lyase [Sphingobacterium siyangense]SUJ04181.1 Cysteine desulfurase [Sphingobacterium multivorum]VXC49230.1 selenocysteine lyase, PLP-dependent [Sphingobacterium multivorum]
MEKFNIDKIRADFPILKREVNGKPLVYLDNGATTQKPSSVINSIVHYYTDMNSNVHRGVHYLSQISTDAFEVTRKKVQAFINAAEDKEIIITKGTTDGINLIATCYGRAFIHEGDEIIISAMEHHSNIVPWQMLCDEKGCKIRVIPMNDKGELDMDAYSNLFNEKTKLVAVTYVSNSLGTINPVSEMISIAHRHGAVVLVDAAQAVQHIQIDVQKLDVDFLVFSGHKMYGPTGVGVLYGKEDLLNAMPPYQGGGDMIKEVTFEKTTYNELPFKFEAGTPNIEAGICLNEAIDYINSIGLENIEAYEHDLLQYATEKLAEIPGMRFFGTAEKKCSVISFVIDGTHPYDVGVILDKLGIAVRTGHHCAQPVMDRFGIPGTIRASLAVYNTKEEIDILVAGIQRAVNMLV